MKRAHGALRVACGHLAAHARTLLLLSEMFPLAPIKPLRFLTPTPLHRHVQLATSPEVTVADLFLPGRWFGTRRRTRAPAVILCAGLKTQARDRKVVFQLAATFARLGIAAIWPRLDKLDRGIAALEQPSTFVSAHRFLGEVDAVDPERISLLGFSVGSSVALVAATDGAIADRVRAILFFGGYYDLFDYLTAVGTGVAACDGRTVEWRADPGAVSHVRGVLEEERAAHVLAALDARTPEEVRTALRAAPCADLERLQAANPAGRVGSLKAPIFILHDKGDHYVPYCESVKLNRALGPRDGKRFLIVDLFTHTQPRAGLTRKTAIELVRFYGFARELFAVL